MTGTEIVREETRRMARGMAPLTLIAFGAACAGGLCPGADRFQPAAGRVLFRSSCSG